MSTHSELEAALLLTLPNTTLETPSTLTSGMLTLSCLTPSSFSFPPLSKGLVDTPKAGHPGVPTYLVLQLHPLELLVDSARPIACTTSSTGSRTYTLFCFLPHYDTIKNDSYMVHLHISPPSSDDLRTVEGLDTLDAIFAAYAPFHTEPRPQPPHAIDGPGSRLSPPWIGGKPTREGGETDLRGRLVLMDEMSGEVVGELPQKVQLTEDAALAGADAKHDAGPVVLELPPDVYDAYGAQPGAVDLGALAAAREIFVQAVPPEEQDWITRSASFMSWAIDSSTSVLLSGITMASTFYINHSTPSPYASSQPSASATAPPVKSETKPSAAPAASSSSVPTTPPPLPLPLPLQILTSPRTHAALASAQAFSGQAVRVSQYTVSFVESLLSRAVGSAHSALQSSSTSVPTDTKNAGTPPPCSTSIDNKPGQAEEKPPLPPRRTPVPSPPPPSERTDAQTHGEVQVPLRTRDRLAVSANLLLATADDSARRMWEVGSGRLAAVVEHKYGAAAAHSTNLAAHTARNVVLVYIDMRGFARRALVRKAGTAWVRARVGARTGQAVVS